MRSPPSHTPSSHFAPASKQESDRGGLPGSLYASALALLVGGENDLEVDRRDAGLALRFAVEFCHEVEPPRALGSDVVVRRRNGNGR